MLLISMMINAVEVHSVFKDMRERPELGRDADVVFWVGVLFRMVVYNVLVLPFGILGRWLRARRLRVMRELSFARPLL